MTSEITAKKDIQKLQRAIVDGLEDVKGQDIVVFNTEHLSPLFERVIVASGTSNRQTKALAASVRDAVREAGFDKPRIEGEDNGEWIIVDCGAAVAHVMQPVIRQYYRLEEIWGAKPVRLKHGAEKVAEAQPVAKKSRHQDHQKRGGQGSEAGGCEIGGPQGRQGDFCCGGSSQSRPQAGHQNRREGGGQVCSQSPDRSPGAQSRCQNCP
jgi:ribosome silencing factor RsfS/YbeB/iojap